jgi:hypothetical protein
MDGSLAYQITKLLYERTPDLVAVDQAAQEITLKSGVVGIPDPVRARCVTTKKKTADCQPRIEISPTFCSRPAPENQPADETLQSLSLAVFNTEEFHAHATRPNASDYGRFDIDRMSFVGEGKSHSQDASLCELAFSVKCATAHRNLHDHPLPSDGARGERNRKIRRQTFILAAIFLDSFVCDTPLETLETVAAKLALEGINIE